MQGITYADGQVWRGGRRLIDGNGFASVPGASRGLAYAVLDAIRTGKHQMDDPVPIHDDGRRFCTTC
ncbi:MAG: hypothetical protein D6791_17030 [Chloroflexi bacterium]|nr:MAG: hypothetical protein D6791_17030 [Chloroflexota bacterium]